MEEKDRILQEAREEAEHIIQMAIKRADEIQIGAVEKRASYQEYIRELTRQGFVFKHEEEEWLIEVNRSDLKKLSNDLKENLFWQKEILKVACLRAIQWETNDWGHFRKCENCEEGTSFTVLKLKMSEIAVNYMEMTLASAKKNYLKWGLNKSLDYLMELKTSIEAQMFLLAQTPEF